MVRIACRDCDEPVLMNPMAVSALIPCGAFDGVHRTRVIVGADEMVVAAHIDAVARMLGIVVEQPVHAP